MQLKAVKFAALLSRLRLAPFALFAAIGLVWPRIAVADSLANYTVLEYIDSGSAGGASIKLDDFQLDYANCVETKVRFNDVGGNQAIFCQRQSSVANTYTLFKTADGQHETDYKPTFRLDYGQEVHQTGYDIVANKDYVLATTPQNLYVNGELKEWTSRAEKSGAVCGDHHLFLFASNSFDSDVPVDGACAKMRMYYFRVYADKNKQELRLNLVPAKKNSDNTIGMYDTVNNRFYGPYSTTTFTTGSTDTYMAKLAAFAAPRSGIDPLASGGDYVYRDGADYVHVFTSPMSGDEKMFFKVNENAKAMLMVVGGGGGGSSKAASSGDGGGGGGGAVVNHQVNLDCGEYAVVVGNGGVADSDGAASSVKDGDAEVLLANGGRAGTSVGGMSGSGMLGGNGNASNQAGGGGGGDSENGESYHTGVMHEAGRGGAGTQSVITGVLLGYGGGGGGGSQGVGPGSASDGGGAGGSHSKGQVGVNGSPASGGGGGGSGSANSAGAGGSGIVVVRVRVDEDPIPFANFIKVSITKRNAETGIGMSDRLIQLSELAFYDAQMNRINKGLTQQVFSLSALKETPGTCYSTGGNTGTGTEMPKLFDGSSGTKHCSIAATSESSSDCNVDFYMHLNQESSIFLYNLMSGGDADTQSRRSPIAWTVQVSADGETWTDFDSRTVSDTAGDAALTGRSTWYNGGGTGSQPIAFYGRVQSNPMVSSMANVSTAYSVGDDYVMVFANANAAASFTLAGEAEARILAVGGGGSGGAYCNGALGRVGGGGAGAMVDCSSVGLVCGTYAVSVGRGGNANDVSEKITHDSPSFSGDPGEMYHGQTGVDSVLSGPNNYQLAAKGGGGGGVGTGTNGDYVHCKGYSGGSGGGGGTYGMGLGGAAIDLAYGNNGGNGDGGNCGGGGGGAGSAGKAGGADNKGGAGGNGRESNIIGEPVFYAGGGSGAGPSGSPDVSGSGIGGKGAQTGGAGLNGTGSGGGGGAGTQGGAGGSGVVIVRLAVPPPVVASLSSSAVAETSATVTLDVSSLGDETDLRAVLRWGTTENCTEGAKILGAVAVGTPLVENLTGLIPGTNYHAKVEFVREDHSRVASANVQPISFATPAVAASAYADILSVTGAARSEKLDDGSLLYVFTDTSAAASFTIAKGGLARLLVVGGGGAGGDHGYHAGTGGGGGGQVVDQMLSLDAGTYNVTVGTGGVVKCVRGSNTSPKHEDWKNCFFPGGVSSVNRADASEAILEALGGGGGANVDDNGGTGANGGGGSAFDDYNDKNTFKYGGGGSGTVGFDGGSAWSDGGNWTASGSTESKRRFGGGGGGAGGFGGSVMDENGRGTGGIGLYSTIFGLPETDDAAWFGGGGAGGAGAGTEGGTYVEVVPGGRGGGASTPNKHCAGVSGIPGTGGGGSGGLMHFAAISTESKETCGGGYGNGGSGIVVLRIYGNMCVPVALNKNGGTTEPNPATVMATPGQEMPQLESGQKLTGTRTGYTFMGYGAKVWEARLMTGDETKDICNEGAPVFAQMKGAAGALNGVSFTSDLFTDSTKKTLQCTGGTWGQTNDYGNYDAQGKTGTYGDLMKHGVFCDVAGVDTATATVTLKNLTRGHSYLFQFFVHDGRTGSGDLPDRSVSVDQETWYHYGLYNHTADETRGEYGVTFICRFVAMSETEDVAVHFKKSPNNAISAQFNAMQLQDITEVNSQIYYNADGSSARTYPANGPSELFAIWQPITYTIKFGGDAETGGTMADLVCTYDVPTNLPPNQLKREYTITLNPNGGSVSPTSLTCSWPFSRWKLDNTHFYDDQAQVTNLTTVNNGTVWLAPQWNEGRVSLPVPSRDGYVFEGWYDGDTKIGNLDSYMCMGPKTLVAHWSLATYTVNYTLNGGTAGTSQPASAMPGTAFEVSAPTKSGCHFIGWKVSGFASGAKWGTSNSAVTTDVTADGLCFNGTSSVWFKSLAAAGGTVTLTAQWRTDVPKPTATAGLVYNGNEQTGVEAATGYSVANGKATNAGDYTATVTLTDGYCWSDGTTDNASISWSIAKAAIVASAADVEKEYDGVAAQIAVTVTTPASGATVTYCTTSNGEYTATNPAFSDFGAHRVYWKVTAANYEEANGSAVVRIGKKAAGEFVRLVITKRKGGDSQDGGGQGDFEFCELNLYEDIAGTPEKLISSGLELASGLADLKNRAGTCYAFPTNFYSKQNVSKLFDGQADGQSKHCCPRNSTSTNFTDAHIEIYMHLSDASKVIRSYNLQSGNDIEVNPARSPTAWRLEVSSDCERWTVIDEKTIDTANEPALNTNKTWYNGGTPYPINLDYVPMEVLETNPCEEGTEAYKKVMNYIQIVGFQLDKDNVVTTRVQYNGTNSGSWDSLFCQRDLKGNGSFAVHRQSSGDKSPRIRFDYGNNQTSVMAKVTGDYKFVASASGGLVTNGYPAVATAPCTWTSLPDNSLLLFASDSASACDGIPVQNWTYLKCYYFQVAESATDSTLRLDLVPASNTVSHAQGLYDRVSGNFYPLQDGGVAGKPTLSGSNTQVTFSKELTAVKGEDGWDQFPLVTEVAYSGTYLTSITNYWQQEWVPAAVTGAGEYRLVMRGQGPYKGAVANVYTVCARVALDANGGTAGATNSVLVLPGKALPNITGAGALPTREGYDFVGYFDGASGGTKYYNADGTGVEGVTYPAESGPAELYAHWQAIKFHVIRPDGPEIVVDWGWLKGAFAGSATKAQYQQCLFTTNDSGVVAWQAYVLGYEANKWESAAIVEETAQNASPDTVTIRLRGMPAEPRTNATTRLAYSLYAARTTEGFAKGEDALVIDGDAKPFEKSEKSTFEAPLSDLTDLEPVNYYRIRVHFIFDGGK